MTMANNEKIMISIALVLLPSLFQLGANGSKTRRIRQLPMTVIAFVYAAAAVVVLTKYYATIRGILLLRGLPYSDNTGVLVVNGVVLVTFAAARLVIRPIVTAVCRSKRVLDRFSLSVYAFDEEYGEWFLKKQWVDYRKYFLAVAFALQAVTCAYLALTWIYGPDLPVWAMFYPSAAVIVINEIFCYLNGQTKEEFEHDVLGDDSDARRVSNYYKIREILEALLPEPLLTAHTGCEYLSRESPIDLLEQMRDSEDGQDKVTASYFDAGGRYKTADIDCVEAVAQMMHRRNVVFYDPFYRDLGMYVTLPLVTALLSGKKCVVLCGRRSAAEDVKNWLEELIQSYSHMRTLWKVRYLNDKAPECEVGVLTFTQVYDKRVINTNREFLNEADFVILIEPSVILNTSQVALSILAEEMHRNDEHPVYCICDRNADGLVDTLSHLLHTEITDVVAMPVPRCSYTSMSWNADGDFLRQQLFDKQTKYLGNGVELAAIAVKNQIPKVRWYSETKSPVKDIQWITGQYYATICTYMNQMTQQKNLYDRIEFIPNLWSAGESKEEFLVAEDEFCNLFVMMRTFLSRGRNQTFVNVLSENYILRDYMRCNKQMFMSNPNAIPSLVPDYAKTERNTVLKLVLTMSYRPVSDAEILKELHLVGLDTDDAFGTVDSLLKRYTRAEGSILTVNSVRRAVDEFTTVSTCMYSISEDVFDKYFAESLKNAFYILEDEKSDEEYIDARLFGHVTQTVLPGQFVTYGGKYYVVAHVSPQSGVVMHRASDLYDGRKYYRQIRRYSFAPEKAELLSCRKVGDVEFSEIRTDFHVDTMGYLEMNDCHDLRRARIIDFSDDPNASRYSRSYRCKSILRIRLPDADENVRFTLSLLLSEIFRSVFPGGWPYLAVLTHRPSDVDGMLNYLVYPVDGIEDDGCIYIVEDSDLDLGLLASVEKNFMRLMEIVADYLDWHFEKLREIPSKDPVPAKKEAAEKEEKKKRSLLLRMFDRIRQLFGGKKQEEVSVSSVEKAEKDADKEAEKSESAAENADKAAAEDTPEEEKKAFELDGEEAATESSAPVISEVKETEPAEEEEKAAPIAPIAPAAPAYSEDELEPGKDDPDIVAVDGTDIFEEGGTQEDNEYLESAFAAAGITPLTKTRYQRECFLKFGYEEIDGRIRADDVRRYLRVRGWCNNSLTLARKREALVKTQLDLQAENHCDFCGLPLTGVNYDRLSDGRVRCNDCSQSTISNVDDFKELFYRTLEMMEGFYDIHYRVPISARMTDANTIAKGIGMVFRPSSDVAVRVLGYAQKKKNTYKLLVENGAPRMAAIDTLVHEMTHIWQYLNWKTAYIDRLYDQGDPKLTAIAKDIVYEGMAMWSSIQYLYQIGKTYYAAQQEAVAASRKDAYGVGFCLYREQYPLVKDSSLLKFTPFHSDPPLDPVKVRNVIQAILSQ